MPWLEAILCIKGDEPPRSLKAEHETPEISKPSRW